MVNSAIEYRRRLREKNGGDISAASFSPFSNVAGAAWRHSAALAGFWFIGGHEEVL